MPKEESKDDIIKGVIECLVGSARAKVQTQKMVRDRLIVKLSEEETFESMLELAADAIMYIEFLNAKTAALEGADLARDLMIELSQKVESVSDGSSEVPEAS